jgi:protein TonB
MSHELFHDVTDRRPRANRAAGGTLALSIVAHALVLAAAIVVPLLATDALPSPVDAVAVFTPPVEPPAPTPAVVPARRTPSAATDVRQNSVPVEAPSQIVDERPPDISIVCDTCVVDPTAPLQPFSAGLGAGPTLPDPPPPPKPQPQRPIRLSSVQMPTKVRDVAPVYPQIAQTAGIQGVVIIEAVIAADGHVRDARVLRSQHALLDRAALDAVREWRYEPTRVGGVAVPVIVTVTVQFRLQR